MTKLFTDTSANLPIELIRRYDITVIPFFYTVDGIEANNSAEAEFDGKAFYEAMRNGASVKTSMIGMESFISCFEKALISGDDILYVGMSGGISGSASSAAVAVNRLKGKFPKLI